MHPVSPTRTLVLTERVPHTCRLRSHDVDFLLARHHAHLEVLPTGQRRRYRVTPTGYVGVIVAPTCRLVIRPKIPLRNLFFLLDPFVPLPADADAITPGSGTEVLDFLAGQFAAQLARRSAAGLHRAYRERDGQGPFLQGRLDLAAQLREPPARKDQLHSVYDDFTADVPCNRVLRATGEGLLGSALVSEGVRAALRGALQGFEGVRPLPPAPEVWDGLARELLPVDYGPLLDLCRLLAEGLAPGEAAGATPGPTFLLDMERVFERYLTRGIRETFATSRRYTVSVQAAHVVAGLEAGQPEVLMRPDLTIDRAGRPVLVMDVKWKRLPRTALVTADLYQVLAYCTALGVARGVLVYPGRADRVWEYGFGPVAVSVRTLRVLGPGEAIARSLRRLARSLKPTSR